MEWGAVGGPAAREAALWVQLQREFRNRNLLPVQAIRRLDALDFPWEPQVALTLPFPSLLYPPAQSSLCKLGICLWTPY